MKNAHVISTSALIAALLLTACSSMDTNSDADIGASKEKTAQVAKAPPALQAGYRFSDVENADIANKNKLSYRMFYNEPSKGANAKWFNAIKRGDLVTVKYMVENGQNIEAKDTGNLDQTALGWAAFIGYEDIVNYLISQGANLQATDKGDVYNVLKSAVLGKNTKIVKKVYGLLNAKKQVDLNDQTLEGDGETLIMVAASNNRLETVKFLLSEGANPNLVATTNDKSAGSYNQGAYSYACSRDHMAMQKLLAANGAINHRTGKASCE